MPTLLGLGSKLYLYDSHHYLLTQPCRAKMIMWIISFVIIRNFISISCFVNTLYATLYRICIYVHMMYMLTYLYIKVYLHYQDFSWHFRTYQTSFMVLKLHTFQWNIHAIDHVESCLQSWHFTCYPTRRVSAIFVVSYDLPVNQIHVTWNCDQFSLTNSNINVQYFSNYRNKCAICRHMQNFNYWYNQYPF